MEQVTEQNNLTDQNKNTKSLFQKIFLGVVVLLVIVVIFLTLKATVFKKSPDEVNKEKIMEVVEKVEKLIALPTDEIPTLAEISDMGPLQNQPFFKKAKIGDQILLYSVSRKAFLYDPKANIVIEVATLNVGQ